MNDLMIDLETLDVIPSSVILSIGAVVFNPDTGVADNELHIKLDLTRQPGRTISGDTVLWWNNQEALARSDAYSGAVEISEALGQLSFLIRNSGINNVWAYSPDFDLAILRHAYEHSVHKRPLWGYKDQRDVRTMYKEACEVYGYARPEFKGVAHSALDDALHQVTIIAQIRKRMRGLN